MNLSPLSPPLPIAPFLLPLLLPLEEAETMTFLLVFRILLVPPAMAGAFSLLWTILILLMGAALLFLLLF